MSKPIYIAINKSARQPIHRVRGAVGLTSTDSVLKTLTGRRVWAKLSMPMPLIPDMILEHIVDTITE